MKIVFIGAGNVATHLAKELYKYNFDIIQIFSRTLESAKKLACEVNALAISDVSLTRKDADIYIFSVKDAALSEIIAKMPANNGLWIHTAGSMSMNIFADFTSRYGVLYPFQTFSKNKEIDWKSLPIFVEASSDGDLNILTTLAQQISDRVTYLPSDKRRYIHLTGVFACNFVNHMYTLSVAVLEEAELSFDIALPLIDETARKIHTMNPIDAQTGPAVRFDENVMNTHLSMIKDKRVKDIYRLISENIYEVSKNKDNKS